MTSVLNIEQAGLIHVRFAGLSFDLLQADLGIAAHSHDQRIRFAVAHALNVPGYRLADYLVERHDDGSLTIRPEEV
jgi:hypothetical protein